MDHQEGESFRRLAEDHATLAQQYERSCYRAMTLMDELKRLAQSPKNWATEIAFLFINYLYNKEKGIRQSILTRTQRLINQARQELRLN